ncbi:MAG: RHS domain-containing protein [Desulfobulbus sp.]|nr:RHS domain-containing protein [Desulfobulbus sp.]
MAGQTIHYRYDLNSQLIAETPIRDYFYLDNQPLAVQEYQTNPGLYYFINDHLGTPQQLIAPTGTVVWQAAYLPYGEAKVQVNTVTNNLRFPGQYFDAETGLHYNWHRFYDPVTGRYISADPIGLEGGLNLYAYVDGNPVNWSDPKGLAIPLTIPPPPAVGGNGIITITPGQWQNFKDDWNRFKNWVMNEGDNESAKRPPGGSKPIDQTPWSGNHKEIKNSIGLKPTDNVKISPDGHVWVENSDGSWTDHGEDGDYTGSGEADGRRGKDR